MSGLTVLPRTLAPLAKLLGISVDGRADPAIEADVATLLQRVRRQPAADLVIPSGVSAWYAPVQATTNWSRAYDVGGALATTNSANFLGEQCGYGLTSTHAAVYASNTLIYTLQASDPKDLRNYSWAIRLYFPEGTGNSLWSGTYSVKFILGGANPATDNRTLTVCLPSPTNLGTEVFGPGWYLFTGSFSEAAWTVTGSDPIAAVTTLRLQYAKTVVTDYPQTQTIVLGQLMLIPTPTRPAQLTIQCDGGFASHLRVASLLHRYGMRATFYLSPRRNEASLTTAQLQQLERMGHCVACYAYDFGAQALVSTAAAVGRVTEAQRWLAAQGIYSGIRHAIHGISGRMSQALWDALVPTHLDTMGYLAQGGTTGTQLTCQYSTRYMGRFHEYNTTNDAAVKTKLAAAIADRSRMGLLVHDVTGANWTAFESFITNEVLTAKAAGTLNVCTVDEAFRIASNV